MASKTIWERLKGVAISSWINIGISLLALIVAGISCWFAYTSNITADKANNLSNTANLLANTANNISLQSNNISEKSYQLSEEVFKIQNTPRLAAQIVGEAYVGKWPNRTDEVVAAAVSVLNVSDAFANDVTLDLMFSDGMGRQDSLNNYFKTIGAGTLSILTIGPRMVWTLPPQGISSPAGSRELYSSGKCTFKMKLLITWRDTKGNEYRFVDLERLKYVRVVDKETKEYFIFESAGKYDSIRNQSEVEKYWGLNFDY